MNGIDGRNDVGGEMIVDIFAIHVPFVGDIITKTVAKFAKENKAEHELKIGPSGEQIWTVCREAEINFFQRVQIFSLVTSEGGSDLLFMADAVAELNEEILTPKNPVVSIAIPVRSLFMFSVAGISETAVCMAVLQNLQQAWGAAISFKKDDLS